MFDPLCPVSGKLPEADCETQAITISFFILISFLERMPSHVRAQDNAVLRGFAISSLLNRVKTAGMAKKEED